MCEKEGRKKKRSKAGAPGDEGGRCQNVDLDGSNPKASMAPSSNDSPYTFVCFLINTE